jgi:hypothetical protein
MPFMLPLVGSALAKVGMGSQLMGLLNIGGAVGGLSMLPMAFGYGQPSEEDQERMMRRQLEIQDEFERSRAGGEMGDLGGLVGGGGMSLEDLMAEELLTRKAARAGRALERFEEARPKYMDELDRILAGQTARIASLQSERTLTPLEIISMVEGGFG